MAIFLKHRLLWNLYNWLHKVQLDKSNPGVFAVLNSIFAYWIEAERIKEYNKRPVDIDGFMLTIWTRWTREPILLVAVFDDGTYQILRDDWWPSFRIYEYLYHNLFVYLDELGYTFEIMNLTQED